MTETSAPLARIGDILRVACRPDAEDVEADVEITRVPDRGMLRFEVRLVFTLPVTSRDERTWEEQIVLDKIRELGAPCESELRAALRGHGQSIYAHEAIKQLIHDGEIEVLYWEPVYGGRRLDE